MMSRETCPRCLATSHSAPGTIRTCDTRFRKPMLYPLSYGGSRADPRPGAAPLCTTVRSTLAFWDGSAAAPCRSGAAPTRSGTAVRALLPSDLVCLPFPRHVSCESEQIASLFTCSTTSDHGRSKSAGSTRHGTRPMVGSRQRDPPGERAAEPVPRAYCWCGHAASDRGRSTCVALSPSGPPQSCAPAHVHPTRKEHAP